MKTGRRSARLRSRMFLKNVLSHTPILGLTILLVMLWMLFSAALYLAEQGAPGTTITSYGRALYWGIAAFSTAGIADTPVEPVSHLIGGVWIVIGSMLFFGAIVATVTAYFMRTLQRPSRQIIDAIEYNLEQLDRLSIDELEMLKNTTDALIENVERLRLRQLDRNGSSEGPDHTSQ
jgi:voltage-gated potassium channel